MKEIIFYKTESNNSPIETFMDSLEDKQISKILWVLKLIKELKIIPQQYFKKLINTDDIWEVRVIFGGNIFRFLCFYENELLIVLTNGLKKKTQKVPKKAIKLAEQRKKDWLKRRNKNG